MEGGISSTVSRNITVTISTVTVQNRKDRRLTIQNLPQSRSDSERTKYSKPPQQLKSFNLKIFAETSKSARTREATNISGNNQFYGRKV